MDMLNFIIPFAAGGPGDTLGRLLGACIAARTGREVMFENIHGSNGIVGSAKVARATPDGRTIVMAASAHYINPAIYRRLPFDPVRDFAPVSLVASGANVLVVHPSLRAGDVRELIALARERPGMLRYASGGYGSPSHLAAELFKVMAGVELVHVPYKGHEAAGIALSEGREVQLMFDATLTAVPHIRAGRWKALGVTTSTPAPILKDVPAIAESGLPRYEVSPSIGVLAPAATPAPAVAELSAEIARIVHTPEVVAQLLDAGSRPVGNAPQEYAAYIRAEIAKWAQVVKDAGIELREAPED